MSSLTETESLSDMKAVKRCDSSPVQWKCASFLTMCSSINAIFPLYRVAIAAFQLSYRTVLLIPSDCSLFNMIITSNNVETPRF